MDASVTSWFGTSWLGDTPDLHQLIRVTVRLLAAVAAGAVIGAQREWSGKNAGLRTHILVSLGCAVFVLGVSEHGFDNDAISRVIQGVVTGVGFLGAGTILKRSAQNTIKGLTTAGSIWVTAAIGVAAGLGQIAVTMVAVVLTWIVLSILVSVESRIKPKKSDSEA
jgi:putative Mg2+ transporter-C (MgtC) family protein